MYYNNFLGEINLFSMKKIIYYWKNQVGTKWVLIVILLQLLNLIMVHIVEMCRKFCILHCKSNAHFIFIWLECTFDFHLITNRRLLQIHSTRVMVMETATKRMLIEYIFDFECEHLFYFLLDL